MAQMSSDERSSPLGLDLGLERSTTTVGKQEVRKIVREVTHAQVQSLADLNGEHDRHDSLVLGQAREVTSVSGMADEPRSGVDTQRRILDTLTKQDGFMEGAVSIQVLKSIAHSDAENVKILSKKVVKHAQTASRDDSYVFNNADFMKHLTRKYVKSGTIQGRRLNEKAIRFSRAQILLWTLPRKGCATPSGSSARRMSSYVPKTDESSRATSRPRSATCSPLPWFDMPSNIHARAACKGGFSPCCAGGFRLQRRLCMPAPQSRKPFFSHAMLLTTDPDEEVEAVREDAAPREARDRSRQRRWLLC